MRSKNIAHKKVLRGDANTAHWL